MYPQYKRGTIKGKKAYWKAKIEKGEVSMPPLPEREPTAEWTVSAFDRVNNEWTSTINKSWRNEKSLPEDAFISQAPPIKIKPSKVKPVTRDYELLAFLPDEQIGYREIDEELIPIHDEGAMSAAKALLKDLQPNYVYANGDSIDFSTMSKYAKDSRHFTPRTVQAAIDRAAVWNAELTEATPGARRVRMAGNHDRLSKYILRNAEEVYGLRRGSTDEAPVLTTAYLTRAEELGWEYVSAYPAEYQHSEDFLVVHGDRVRSNGSTAELMSKTYPYTNVVFGHVHRRELHTHTDRDGKTYTAASFGTLARIDGAVPSYRSSVNEATNRTTIRHENWQQGIGLVESYEGGYNFIFAAINQGILNYRGKQYGTV